MKAHTLPHITRIFQTEATQDFATLALSIFIGAPKDTTADLAQDTDGSHITVTAHTTT